MGAYHASDNSCLPPESVAVVRVCPRSGAVPCPYLTLGMIAALLTSKSFYENVMLPQVTDRNKVMRKPVDINIYTMLSMAPCMPNFGIETADWKGTDPASSHVELKKVPIPYRLKSVSS